jgi:peptidyl-prolyl isomerase E (cyclophilin E)
VVINSVISIFTSLLVQAAIDNMNDGELYGRTLRCNLAKPMKIKEGSSRPVWATDEWLQKYAGKNLVL